MSTVTGDVATLLGAKCIARRLGYQVALNQATLVRRRFLKCPSSNSCFLCPIPSLYVMSSPLLSSNRSCDRQGSWAVDGRHFSSKKSKPWSRHPSQSALHTPQNSFDKATALHFAFTPRPQRSLSRSRRVHARDMSESSSLTLLERPFSHDT